MLATILLISALIVTALMIGLWVVSLQLKDASIVDIFWGLGFVIIAWAGWFVSGSVWGTPFLLVCLTTIWGIRLSIYLAWRNLGKPEDHRYQAMRRKFGDRFPLASLFVVFGLQGLIMWVVALPISAGQIAHGSLNFWVVTGGLVWAIGLTFETVGDLQLSRFKANPANRGRVCDRGLWRYTRHPNYFGDFLVWWGLYVVAAGNGAAWTIISPLLMSFLLIRVSGVTLLEKSLAQSKEGYAEYIARTSAFVPLPPRKSAV